MSKPWIHLLGSIRFISVKTLDSFIRLNPIYKCQNLGFIYEAQSDLKVSKPWIHL